MREPITDIALEQRFSKYGTCTLVVVGMPPGGTSDVCGNVKTIKSVKILLL